MYKWNISNCDVKQPIQYHYKWLYKVKDLHITSQKAKSR